MTGTGNDFYIPIDKNDNTSMIYSLKFAPMRLFYAPDTAFTRHIMAGVIADMNHTDILDALHMGNLTIHNYTITGEELYYGTSFTHLTIFTGFRTEDEAVVFMLREFDNYTAFDPYWGEREPL